MDTKMLVKMAMLIALSGIGAMIKIQGSIALDAVPGFYAALLLGPMAGGIVAFAGHLISALTAGFPMTVPMHLVVAVEMFIIVALFSVVWQKINPWVAIIVGILLNGVGAGLLVVPMSILLGLPLNGWALFAVIWMPLLIGSTVNILIAASLYKIMGKGKSVNGN
ncbi:ECF transporter S component [Alkaliphilus metalliredigens]|nr:ECF transporter S component [Alkaliphilus metalliredigens]